MPVNINYGSWKVLQRSGGRGALRAPITLLFNLGHHPPLSPRGFFLHHSDETSMAPGFCFAHSANLHCMLGVRDDPPSLVPGASSLAPLLFPPFRGAVEIVLAMSATRAGMP